MSMEPAREVRDSHSNTSHHTECARHCIRQTTDVISFYIFNTTGR